MHPKEFKKTKNGTGRLTHLSLPNSELYIDIDFSKHTAVNALIDNPDNACYVLYPGNESIDLNTQKIESLHKQIVIFIIDSTWPCSVKMLRLSQNIQALPRLSFTHSKCSQFHIKEQPKAFCLSTIESTQTLLELLCLQGIETIPSGAFERFLDPFTAMVSYQMGCASQSKSADLDTVRYKKRSLQDSES